MFPEEPLALRITREPDGIAQIMSELLAALELRAADAPQPSEEITSEPLEELQLKFRTPYIEEKEGKRRAIATAELTYFPALKGKPPIKTRQHQRDDEKLRFFLLDFQSPLQFLQNPR